MRRVVKGKRGVMLLAVVACLPCCLPLLPVVVGAVLVASGGFAVSGSAWLALGLLLAGGVAAGVLLLLRWRRRVAALPLTRPLVLHDHWPRAGTAQE